MDIKCVVKYAEQRQLGQRANRLEDDSSKVLTAEGRVSDMAEKYFGRGEGAFLVRKYSIHVD